MAVYPFERRVPGNIWLEFLDQTASADHPTRRRMALLGVLWNESHHTAEALMARVEAVAGSDCFGKQSALTFASDIRFVRKVLHATGHQLKYSRDRKQPGYCIPGRPELDEHLVKVIDATVAEVNPEQAAIFAKLSPAQRVEQGARLSEHLLAYAAQRLQGANPDLTEGEARREALERMYALDR